MTPTHDVIPFQWPVLNAEPTLDIIEQIQQAPSDMVIVALLIDLLGPEYAKILAYALGRAEELARIGWQPVPRGMR